MVKNLFTLIFIFPALFIAGLLTGCVGWGSAEDSGISKSSLVKWSAITPPEIVTASGISTEASFIGPWRDDIVNEVSEFETSTNSSASITFRADGSISAISIETPDTTLEWDESSGEDIIVEGSDTPYLTASDPTKTQIALAIDPTSPYINWDYQTFGTWKDASGSFGSISIGAPTAGGSIPTTDKATFNGYTTGTYIDLDGVYSLTESTLKVNANFETLELGFLSSETKLLNDDLTVKSEASYLNMYGTLTYVKGTNSFTGNVDTIGDPVLSGTSTGQFYGPNAEELGGVFSLSGTGVESYAGAYGAKQ